MDFVILYWHWIVFGIILVLSEIFVATFFVLWFGVAAIVVGLLMLLIPTMPFAAQSVLWAIVSTALTVVWFKWLKPIAPDKTKAGLSREALLGQIGQVIKVPIDGNRGTVRFPAPVLGNDEWVILSNDILHIGDRVTVQELSGNSLIVSKV